MKYYQKVRFSISFLFALVFSSILIKFLVGGSRIWEGELQTIGNFVLAVIETEPYTVGFDTHTHEQL